MVFRLIKGKLGEDMFLFKTMILDKPLEVHQDDKGFIAYLGRWVEFRNRSMEGLMRIAYQMARNINS